MRAAIILGLMTWLGGPGIASPCASEPGDRSGGFPTAETGPEEPRGHLFIVGGGARPAALMRRFVELAGGRSDAHVVVLPLASGSPREAGAAAVAELEALGARARVLVPTREQAESPAADSLLDGATAIWFTGGDQARVTPVLLGTRLNASIRALYARGGVLGGTSAGAAVMSDPMLTGKQVRETLDYYGDEFPRIARDYIDLQPGLGYLRGTILDQHFTTRERHNRLLSAVLSNPELLGVGIDESTALLVRPDGSWEVLGKSVVSVYDAREATITSDSGGALGAGDIRLHVLPPGSRFDPATGIVRMQPESHFTEDRERGSS